MEADAPLPIGTPGSPKCCSGSDTIAVSNRLPRGAVHFGCCVVLEIAGSRGVDNRRIVVNEMTQEEYAARIDRINAALEPMEYTPPERPVLRQVERRAPEPEPAPRRTSVVDRDLYTRIDNVWKWVKHLDGRSKAAATGFANLIQGVESLATEAGAEIGKLQKQLTEQKAQIDELRGEVSLLRAQSTANGSQPRRIVRGNTREQDHAAQPFN
jgi:hypothetical protein